MNIFRRFTRKNKHVDNESLFKKKFNDAKNGNVKVPDHNNVFKSMNKDEKLAVKRNYNHDLKIQTTKLGK